MSSSNSSAPDKPQNGLWGVLASPVAAGLAFPPTFRDLAIKSSQQLGLPPPSMSFRKSLKQGARAAPMFSLTVGLQKALQERIEREFRAGSKEKQFSFMFLSSATVGGLSAPCLAILNGLTLGWSPSKSLSKLSPIQCAAIVIQETSFLAGTSAGDYLLALVSDLSGHKAESSRDNIFLQTGAAAVSGAIGSVFGHPANVLLTRQQKGLRIDHISQLTLGLTRRTKAVAIISGCFTLFSNLINGDESHSHGFE